MLIWKGNFTGQSDSKWNGIPDSFAECIGVDGHSTPGLLKVHQKLTKNSGSTVDEFCKVSVSASTGYHFWFSADSGKIYARASNGTWTLAYTTVAGAGEHKCLGAMEFDGYIYWATQSRLHRVTIAGADDSWAAGAVTLNFATFGVTDASFHPMALQDIQLFIGDGNQVASVDEAGVFLANALDLNTPFRIKSMAAYDIDLLIGTYVADSVNKTQIVRWDTVSPTWNTSDPIEENGINCFIRDDNYLYVNAGKAGNLYVYDGQYLLPYKRIPGSYTSSAYGEIYPNAVGNFNGVPVFGFSNGSGNPAKQGVYSFGSYSRDYPKVLDLSWVISQNIVASVEIGAILVSGLDLYVSWKDGSNYGVDKIDYTAKYASAYLETRMLGQDVRNLEKVFARIAAYYNSLPASTGITFSYSINGAAYVAMTSVTNTELNEIFSDLSIGKIGSLQIKVAFTVSANDAPTVEVISIDFQSIEDA